MNALDFLQPLLAGARAGSVRDLLADDEEAPEVLVALAPLSEQPSPPSIEWSVVNVDRVDASLTSGGREWRLVYFVAADEGIRAVHLYEKPPPYEPVADGLVIVVNGPSGAGKSTLIEAVRTSAPDLWVAFDEPVMGTVDPAYWIWRDVAPSLHRGVFAAIAALAREGNQVITAAGGFPFDLVQTALERVRAVYVGLDCPLEVLLERELGREGRWGGIAESSLAAHEGWTYDLRFDSSTESAESMAERTFAFLSARR